MLVGLMRLLSLVSGLRFLSIRFLGRLWCRCCQVSLLRVLMLDLNVRDVSLK